MCRWSAFGHGIGWSQKFLPARFHLNVCRQAWSRYSISSTLSSVEDDGLGEELNVIWELEPGARVVEKVALPEPTGFDFWGVSSSADLRRSDQTGFNHHLVKPADFMKVKKILESISVNPT